MFLRPKFLQISLTAAAAVFFLSGCAQKGKAPRTSSNSPKTAGIANRAVNFNHQLDTYKPKKKKYSFYFSYKIIHPWWDAVALGIEDAVRQFEEEKGVLIEYDYIGFKSVSPQAQIEKIEEVSKSKKYDVLAVDVAERTIVTPAINEAMRGGQKVMTFSSSDACMESGCERIAYVGNTHNKEDGKMLAEALCDKLGESGNIAILLGSEGVPCHEERAEGVREVLEGHPGIKVVAEFYDDDSKEAAQAFSEKIMDEHEDLAGVICLDMTCPAIVAGEAERKGRAGDILIVGMDHDKDALHYLKSGIIYALAVQDCYSMGFDTIQVAVKIADGLAPGDGYQELTSEKTTLIYQDDAMELLQSIYGESR